MEHVLVLKGRQLLRDLVDLLEGICSLDLSIDIVLGWLKINGSTGSAIFEFLISMLLMLYPSLASCPVSTHPVAKKSVV